MEILESAHIPPYELPGGEPVSDAGVSQRVGTGPAVEPRQSSAQVPPLKFRPRTAIGASGRGTQDKEITVNGNLTRRRFFAQSAATAAAVSLSPGILAAPRRPNIVLCMGDDHGWFETGYNNHPYLRTPTLDEMAAKGLKLERMYSAAPLCSPTRGSIMTGRHPNRYGTFAPNCSLRPEEITIARILGNAGYVCGHFGKWHLGPVKAGSPTNPGAMGFHEWLSHDNFFEMNPPLVRNGGPVQRFEGESSEIIMREAIRFIGDAKRNGKPSFTVVWFGSPHAPYSGTTDDLALYKDLKEVGYPLSEVLRGRYAEITALDRSMGELRKFLRAQGLRQNTLIWYCGDNGVWSDGRLNMPLRGFKGQIYDGGLRVPGIIEWPDGIPAPKSSDVNAVTTDMLPTICDLLGLPLPDRPLDGISLRSAIENRMAERPKPICFWQYDGAREAKENPEPYIDPELQLGTTPTTSQDRIPFRNFRHPRARTSNFGGTAAILDNRYKLVAPKEGAFELYDVRSDIGESKDLSSAQPGVVKEMERQLRDWQRSVEVSLTGADYRG